MNAWSEARWLAVTIVGLALTLIVLLLAALDAPAALRTPPALLVFIGATGFALVGPGRSLRGALRWSIVVGLSVAVDFLAAELLLTIHLFTLSAFVWLLLVIQILAAAVHVAFRRRTAAVSERAAA